VLNDKDVLILKMALERRMVDATGYAKVRASLARGVRVAQGLREAGVGGKEVGFLVDIATPLGAQSGAMIPARADVENILVGRALVATGMTSQPEVERAQGLVDRAAAQEGVFYSVAEVLAEEHKVDLLAASNLRTGEAFYRFRLRKPAQLDAHVGHAKVGKPRNTMALRRAARVDAVAKKHSLLCPWRLWRASK